MCLPPLTRKNGKNLHVCLPCRQILVALLGQTRSYLESNRLNRLLYYLLWFLICIYILYRMHLDFFCRWFFTSSRPAIKWFGKAASLQFIIRWVPIDWKKQSWHWFNSVSLHYYKFQAKSLTPNPEIEPISEAVSVNNGGRVDFQNDIYTAYCVICVGRIEV